MATELPFEPFLAQGGLGDYSFTLETQRDGDWVTVSNDMNIKLTVPTTATPPADLVAAPGVRRGRRRRPSRGPMSRPRLARRRNRRRDDLLRRRRGGAEPSATPTVAVVAAVATATRTRTAAESVFWADRYNLASGECTNLHWDVQNVDWVYLNGNPADGQRHASDVPDPDDHIHPACQQQPGPRIAR